MEAALRTVYAIVTGTNLESLDITPVRGLEGVKEAAVEVGPLGKVKVAVAHGLANVLWLRTIAVGGAGRTGVVAYLTPVLALTYLGLFFNQWPPLYSAIGLGMILLAVALAESHRQRRNNSAAK